ncbi:MAG: hypothetical protein NTW29_16440 [Bacteroidetes bacterium]|nr:hypothetical protein [Bacteroidota bacterium]
MKKLVLFIAALAVMTSSFASVSPLSSKEPVLRADKMFFPVGKTGKTISLLTLSRISVKEFQALTGQKMNFFDKMSFKIAQKKVRDNIDRDGTINNKKIEKAMLKKRKGGESGFHFGGFALGFFLGLIGVLIAYLLNDDYKRNRVKWSWIGLAASVVLSIILIVAVFSSIT